MKTVDLVQEQLAFRFEPNLAKPSGSYRDRLVAVLNSDLDFQGQPTGYASHSFHAFPAKFPPQLPRLFIEQLATKDDVILDPMMGSGTTVVEAFLAKKRVIGCDIDPLARLQTQVKTTPLNPDEAICQGQTVLEQAATAIEANRTGLEARLENSFNKRTKKFIDYWFAHDTQVELKALIEQIELIENPSMRAFMQLAFSAIIITKSGGVSLAFDLAHTRPHRAKIVLDGSGEIILGHELIDDPHPRIQFLTKTLKSTLLDFERRLASNAKGLYDLPTTAPALCLKEADAQHLPLEDGTIDLIVTSPPYASNAIDYMRAHKFALVWLGYPIGGLGEKRGEYIGGEGISDFNFEALPDYTQKVVADVAERDAKKGKVLHRYYSEMLRVLREMHRVLRPGKAAIVVVGNSVMRDRDTETQTCLAELGKLVGFEVPSIGVRHLDRDRRMLPAGAKKNKKSQIQQRMHEEYVIGFYKPFA